MVIAAIVRGHGLSVDWGRGGGGGPDPLVCGWVTTFEFTKISENHMKLKILVLGDAVL